MRSKLLSSLAFLVLAGCSTVDLGSVVDCAGAVAQCTETVAQCAETFRAAPASRSFVPSTRSTPGVEIVLEVDPALGRCLGWQATSASGAALLASGPTVLWPGGICEAAGDGR